MPKKGKVRLVKLNWDEEHRIDILTEKGFDVTEPAFTKEKKNLHGLHSPLFATDWDDDNAFADRYRCGCKSDGLIGRKYEGDICPKCNQMVTYKDADLSKTAWINLDNYHLIQPIYYNMLLSFIGKKFLPMILQYDPEITLNGKLTQKEIKNSPFAGIGMVEFYNQYDKIIRYYKKKNKKKKSKMILANILINEKDAVFTQHIPVYTAVLRPVSFKGENFVYGKIDTKYNTIYAQCTLLNDNDKLTKKIESLYLKGENTNHLDTPNILWNIQYRLLSVWQLIFEQVTQKDGQIRGQILGGRVDYSGRSVIIPDPTLRADEIKICYLSFLELYRYEIEMYISKLNNISMNKADAIWNKAKLEFDQSVYDIMQYIITTDKAYTDLNRKKIAA